MYKLVTKNTNIPVSEESVTYILTEEQLAVLHEKGTVSVGTIAYTYKNTSV